MNTTIYLIVKTDTITAIVNGDTVNAFATVAGLVRHLAQTSGRTVEAVTNEIKSMIERNSK